MQTQVLFVVIAAYVWLRERVTAGFVLGALATLLGVAVMQWRDGPWASDLVQGTAWGLCAAVAFGTMQVITRRVALDVEPLRFNAERLWLSVVWFALLFGRGSDVLDMRAGTVALLALSAFFGPFLGRVALIYAARHIEAGMATLVGLLAPVLVLLLGLLVHGTAPRSIEQWGGALVIAGTVFALRTSGPPAPRREGA
jgi:drug/metabolite transporter (DMT)-like permease